MGLPLRHPSSFSSLTSGASSPGGPSSTDSDLDLDAEPSSRSSRHHHLKSPHRRSRSRLSVSSRSNAKPTHLQQHRKHHRHRSSHRCRAGSVRPAAAETHHVKPHNPWAADADEGRALARSNILLPGEHTTQQLHLDYEHERHHRRSSSRSLSSSEFDSRERRPPSLERQDAFRDEKTVKRRRRSSDEPKSSLKSCFSHGRSHVRLDDEDAREVAELYRMGLLYDDEHERGEGFSLQHIVREEPVYSVRIRPARRGRPAQSAGFVPSFAVNLSFSAFAEDEALAGWMLSASHRSEREEFRDSWQKAAHDPPRLTVIYELADDAASAVSADDFLEPVSFSEVSHFVGEEEEDEMDWAFLGGCNWSENAAYATAAASMVEVDEEVDPWVVLGHDGS